MTTTKIGARMPVFPAASTSEDASSSGTVGTAPTLRASNKFDALTPRAAQRRDGSSSLKKQVSVQPRLPDIVETPRAQPEHPVPANAAPPVPLPATPSTAGNILSFVPPGAESGGGFAGFANMLGANRKGVHAVSLFSKKPMNSMLNAASTNVHGKFPYDATPVTELVNGAVSGATAIAAHKVKNRYEQKVNDMLAEDLAHFKLSSTNSQKTLKTGLTDYEKLSTAQKNWLKDNPTLPENQLITTDAKGNWVYDKAKLTRIAKDTSHPRSEHARDVLAAMSIAENKGKQKRGAILQALSSGVGVAATSAQIAGTHGAIIPALVTGHAALAGKETFDLRKPFQDARQTMRNEKSNEVLRFVNQRMEGLNPLPGDAPLEAQAGIYATAFEVARAQVAEQKNFGFRVPGSMINDRKSAAFKSDAQDIANKRIGSIVQNGMNEASEESLQQLGSVDKQTGLTRSQREKQALALINEDVTLKAVHTLLTDTGIPKGEAATLISKMSGQTLALRTAGGPVAPPGTAAGNAAKPLTADQQRAKIANVIGEPSLKPADPLKDTEGKIKSSLAFRS